MADEDEVPGGTPEGGMSAEDDELARRRAAAKKGDDGEGADPDRESIEAKAAAAADVPTDEEDDGQAFFVMEHGKRVTLSTLYKRDVAVVIEFKLGSKAIKGGEGTGLVSFSDPDLLLVVPVRAGKVEIDPTYDTEGSVKKVTIRPNLKPTGGAYDARTNPARRLLGLPELDEPPAAANA